MPNRVALDLLCIVAVALSWGLYPLLSRSAGNGGPFATLVLSLAALVPILSATVFETSADRPPVAALGRIGAAGLLMGVGTLAFNRVANGTIEASVSIPTIDAAMIFVTTLGAAYFFGETLTAQKMLGLALLFAGIALLRPA